MRAFVGCDIGTSRIKLVAISDEGNVLFAKSAPCDLLHGEGGIFEQDPSQWLQGFFMLWDELKASLGKGVKVSALSIVGHAPSLVATDEGGRPIAPARTWLDRRGTELVDELEKILGKKAPGVSFIPKLWFVKSRERELYEKTRFFLFPADFLAFRLTGTPRLTHPDIPEYDPCPQSDLEKLDLANKVPKRARPGEVLGDWMGIPVVAGGLDFVAALVGAGVASPRLACDRAETSEGLNVATEKPVRIEGLLTARHPINGSLFNVSGMINSAGAVLSWGARTFGCSLEDLIALAERSTTRAVFLPYISGERAPIWDPRAKGVLFGLESSADRGAIARAIVEGTVFCLKHLLCVMRKKGIDVNEVRMVGGLARFPFLAQMRADILGVKVAIPQVAEASALGAAIISACGVGEFKNLAEASKSLAKIARVFEPSWKRKDIDVKFEIFLELYSRTKDLMERLEEVV